MAEPTLKDVLDAIAKLRAETKDGFARVDAEMKEGFAHVDKRFDDLDNELTTHAKVHRKIEEDITLLKGRGARTAARPTRRPRTR